MVVVGLAGCAAPASYLEVIADGSETEQLRTIAFLEDRRAGVDHLAALAAAERETVRRRAVVALARIEAPSTLPTLTEALADAALPVRLEAAFALGQLGIPAAEAPLLDTLDETLPYPLMVEVWRALGRVGSMPSLERAGRAEGPARVPALMAAATIIRRLKLEPQSFEWVRHTMGADDPQVIAAGLYIYLRAHAEVPEWVRKRAGGWLTHRDATVVELAVRLLQRGVAGVENEVGTVLLNPAFSIHQRAVIAQGIGRTRGEATRALLMAALPALVAQARERLTSPVVHVLREVVLGLSGRRLSRGRRARLGVFRNELKELKPGSPAAARRQAWLVCAFSRVLGEADGCTGAERVQALAAAGAKPEVLRVVLATGTPSERMAVLGVLGDATAEGDILLGLRSGDLPVAATAAELAVARRLNTRDIGAAVAAAHHQAIEARDWEPAQILLRALVALNPKVANLDGAMRSENLAYARTAAALAGKRPLERDTPTLDQTIFEAEPPRLPTALHLEMELGSLEIALRPDLAPRTVAKLAELVEKKFYDGLTFHRLVPNFVAQGGDPRGDGWGGSLGGLRCENNRQLYVTGTVGMALAGKDTGGSQFFLTLAPQPHLFGTYPVIGQLESGFAVLDTIIEGDPIVRATVHYPED